MRPTPPSNYAPRASALPHCTQNQPADFRGMTDRNNPIALDTTMQRRQITIWHPDTVQDLSIHLTVVLTDGHGDKFPARIAT
jgi:hypothetical protein